jgi:hypothetical protein
MIFPYRAIVSAAPDGGDYLLILRPGDYLLHVPTACFTDRSMQRFIPAFCCIVSYSLLLSEAFAGSTAAGSSADQHKPEPRPNVVVLFADDLGYSDIGCFGGEIETPHLDRLAARGVRFSQFYNAGRCCPARASLLTGLYPHQAGVGFMVYRNWGKGYQGYLNRRCVTFAEVLGEAGYQTMMVGKWHCGHVPPSRPEVRGFDYFTGVYLHIDSYWKVKSCATATSIGIRSS